MKANHHHWTLLLTIIATLAFACTKDKKKSVSDQGEKEELVVVVNAQLGVDFVEKDGTTVLELHNLPKDTKKVTCQINNTPEIDCSRGLRLEKLGDGRYDLTVKVETDGQPLTYRQTFSVKNGKIAGNDPNDKTGETGGSSVTTKDPRFILTAKNPFKNYEAHDRSQPLTLEFTLDSNVTCNSVRYLCSSTDGIWSLCNKDATALVSLTPGELGAGFQKLFAKAQCDEGLESNVLEFYWFGVEPGYQPLTLTKRKVKDITHYLLARQNDCLDKLSYKCRDDASKNFETCANVKSSPAKGFEIRAVCTIKDQIVEGPVLAE